MPSMKQLLFSNIRSQSGCYTCRLRRKKCDERQPVCVNCAALHINCHYSEHKPEWMDGGVKQRAMAELIKVQIKRQAGQRRDRKYMEILEKSTRRINLNSDTDKSLQKPALHHQPAASIYSNRVYGSGQDMHLVMVFVDFVFPYQFPYYNPPILAGGRGWLLDALLHSSRSLYYTCMSLASWFFCIVLAADETDPSGCRDRLTKQMHKSMSICLNELQKTIISINAKKNGFDLREGLVVLQSVIKMMTLEVRTVNKQNWKVHLDAAVALFLKMVPETEGWTGKLLGLYSSHWPPTGMDRRKPWSTEQAGFRFATANLLYIDVMSSITLCRPPKLADYHAHVIPKTTVKTLSAERQQAGPPLMEDVFGLHNWVVRMLGEIASLAAWKKEQKGAGRLSIAELASRGQTLSQTIKSGIEQLKSQNYAQNAVERAISVIGDPLSSLNPESGNGQPRHVINNLIWLHGASIYLSTVLSGWQPQMEEVRRSVEQMTELLMNIPGGKTMQSMAWPFCVASCFARAEEEDKYRGLVNRLGPLQVFGSIEEAKCIMEAMWAKRDWIDESCDIAECLNSLGHNSLLF